MISVLELSILQCDACDVTYSTEKGDEYFYDESKLIKQAISKDWVFLEDHDAETVSHYCPKCAPKEVTPTPSEDKIN